MYIAWLCTRDKLMTITKFWSRTKLKKIMENNVKRGWSITGYPLLLYRKPYMYQFVKQPQPSESLK